MSVGSQISTLAFPVASSLLTHGVLCKSLWHIQLFDPMLQITHNGSHYFYLQRILLPKHNVKLSFNALLTVDYQITDSCQNKVFPCLVRNNTYQQLLRWCLKVNINGI